MFRLIKPGEAGAQVFQHGGQPGHGAFMQLRRAKNFKIAAPGGEQRSDQAAGRAGFMHVAERGRIRALAAAQTAGRAAHGKRARPDALAERARLPLADDEAASPALAAEPRRGA